MLTNRKIAGTTDARWREVLTHDEVHILQDLSDKLKLSLDTLPAEEEDCDAETDYHALWIGLLLGSGECTRFDNAYKWASFVRYRTEGLVS